MRTKLFILTLALFFISAFDGNAATKSVKAKAPSGYQLLVLADSDGSAARSSSSGSVSVDLSDGTQGRLYLLNSDSGALAANVILAIKKGGKYYTWKQAKTEKLCKGNASAIYGFSIKGSKLNVGSIKLKSGWSYITASLGASSLNKSAVGTINNKCEPTGTAETLGYGSSAAQRI